MLNQVLEGQTARRGRLPSWEDSRNNQVLRVQRWAFWWKALGIISLAIKRYLLETTAEESSLCLFTFPESKEFRNIQSSTLTHPSCPLLWSPQNTAAVYRTSHRQRTILDLRVQLSPLLITYLGNFQFEIGFSVPQCSPSNFKVFCGGVNDSFGLIPATDSRAISRKLSRC